MSRTEASAGPHCPWCEGAWPHHATVPQQRICESCAARLIQRFVVRHPASASRLATVPGSRALPAELPDTHHEPLAS